MFLYKCYQDSPNIQLNICIHARMRVNEYFLNKSLSKIEIFKDIQHFEAHTLFGTKTRHSFQTSRVQIDTICTHNNPKLKLSS